MASGKTEKIAKKKLEEVEKKIIESKTSEKIIALEQFKTQLNKFEQNFLGLWETAIKHQKAETQAVKRQKAINFLNEKITLLENFKKKLDLVTRPSKEISDAILRMSSRVLYRFALVDGFLPLRRNKDFLHPETASGVPLMYFSTGQKVQTFVAMMVAQNLLALNNRSLLPSILILDDVSTSYDISNLTREALLWRQLAYGYSKEEDLKRQVFISSHHEDLTNNLIDMLTPPQGKRMRLLRFSNWNAETGPDIKQFEITPTGAATDESKRQLKDALCNPYF